LSVTGTAEELDTQLAATLVGFVASHLQMKNALEKAKSRYGRSHQDCASRGPRQIEDANQQDVSESRTPTSRCCRSPDPNQQNQLPPSPLRSSTFPHLSRTKTIPISDEGFTSEPEESEELGEVA
jgi:hypothetical protein